MELRDCWFLSGPTASGKSALGLELARRLGAEILSLDSMAIYRGLDIGTAKPTPAQQAEVKHHLIDLVEPDQQFSVAQYRDAARAAVDEIESRGRVPVFVGGTPLYLKALLRGMFEGPAADWDLRRRWQALAETAGPQHLHARLAEVDPQSARRLHPQDVRRVVRALEVWELTGQSISQLQQQFDRARPADQCRVFVLDWPIQSLAQRIDRRVEQMFAAGLVEEVRALLDRGTTFGPGAEANRGAGLGRTAGQAVGYREVMEFVQGLRDLASTIDLVKLRTRQFAKRQRTWFRSLSECQMVACTDESRPEVLARQIAQQ